MIKINELCKSYGNHKQTEVLKNISLNIKDGEAVALLGHNGSGKSTLIKCIVGILKPTSGNVCIDDLNSFKNRKRIISHMGVIFNQKPSFITDLNVRDNLLFFKAIYNIQDKDYNTMLEIIDNHLNIKELYEKPYRKLSFGERVKCEIASVLLHSPKYIILDEPTIGLDYVAKEGLYKLLKYFKDIKKSTILITTHEVDYIEEVCDRAIILSRGEVKYDDTPIKICNSLNHTVSIIFKYDDIMNQSMAKSIFDEADTVDYENKIITHSCFHSESKTDYIQKITEAFSISSINTKNATLREVFEDVLKEVSESE